MRMSTMIRNIEKLADYGVEALALEIHDLLNKYQDGYGLNELETLILGLGYSEFLAEGNDDMDYVNASSKRHIILKSLGIDSLDLYVAIEKTYGRTVEI